MDSVLENAGPDGLRLDVTIVLRRMSCKGLPIFFETGTKVPDRLVPTRMAMSTIDELHRQYRHSLAGKRDDLRRAWDAMCGENASVTQAEYLHLLLHRLAGSAGTYGHAEISARAKVLEQDWTHWLAQPMDIRPAPYRVCAAQAAAMVDLLDALKTQ